ncbi:AAA family ATPase [Sphingomonas sp. ID1715]|uniref:AAA family ATPase n=1 Tax=Sphingomonas sp. ID1715 TaxID=1656898 RepID=UPI0014898600|nr:AAA family ATPase [Sphingomonas sp. ID1715]
MTATICLHGPESTGKSTLGPRLAEALGGIYVEEFGRTWSEAKGLGFTMTDLVAIAKGHMAATRDALNRRPPYVILDTDPLMTAVWADMLFGERDPWFDRFQETADFYLMFDIDLPWVPDGTRMFGTEELRRRFFELSRAELERRGLPYAMIVGHGEERFANAMKAIQDATRAGHLAHAA